MKRAMLPILLVCIFAVPGAAAIADSDAEDLTALSLRAAALYFWNAPAEAFSREAASDALAGITEDALFQKDAPLFPLPENKYALRTGAKKASGELLNMDEVLPMLTVGAAYPLVLSDTGARVSVRYVGECGYAMMAPVSDWDAQLLFLAFGNVKSFDRRAAVLSVGMLDIAAQALLETQGFSAESGLSEGLRLYFSGGAEKVAGIVSME